MNTGSMISKMMSSTKQPEDINDAILLLIDSIYLTIFSKRKCIQPKSVSHITRCVCNNINTINKMNITTPLSLELEVIGDLQYLLNTILTNKPVSPIIPDSRKIKALLGRWGIGSTNERDRCLDVIVGYVDFVLTIASQLSIYDTNSVMIPRFIFCGDRYIRTIYDTETPFMLSKMMVSTSPEYLWNNIIKGFLGCDQSKLRELLSSLAIDIYPDSKTGLGITHTLYEQALKNGYTGQYSSSSPLVKIKWDEHVVHNNVTTNVSMEADSDIESDPPTEEGDNKIDEPTDENTNTTSPDNTGNTNEYKKPMLGVEFEIVSEETFDEIMYKISVAKFIENMTQEDRDKYPPETISLLNAWKNMFLFVVSVANTRQLLGELKIKFRRSTK